MTRAIVAGEVMLILVLMWISGVTELGVAFRSSGESTVVSAATHPALILWSIIILATYFYLPAPGSYLTKAMRPSMWHRGAAFLLDFFVSGFVCAAILAVVPLVLESRRTGQFQWEFVREHFVSSDWINPVIVLGSMVLIFLYFAFPITKGRQTIGCYLLRLATVTEDGRVATLSRPEALLRTVVEFCGAVSFPITAIMRAKDGRTWYDTLTRCKVVRY